MSQVNVDKNAAMQPAPAKSEQSPYLLLFIILVLAAVATWIIPAGKFDHETRNGVTFAIKGSLHEVARTGVYPGEIFMAIVQGVIKAAPIIFLILFTGGLLAVIEATGAIATALNSLSRSTKISDTRLILIFAVIFAILGSTGVVQNSVVAFVPIGLLVARSLGLPPVIGMALIYLTCAAGFNVAFLGPATTGLTQHLAQLPLFSGMLLRGITNLLFVLTVAIYLIITVKRMRKNGQVRVDTAVETAAPMEITGRHKLILLTCAVTLILFMVGTVQLHWATNEMSAMFIILSIMVGLIGRLSGSAIANTFLSGCSQLVKGGFIVGMAGAISVVLQQGNILDPIVGFLSDLLAPVPPAIAAVGMFVSAALMHFGISSGSGESALLIPIFSPLGDNLGLTRQVTVQTVLLGEGIVNSISPTSGVLMAALATANISFGKWLKFVAPVVAIWFAICVVTLLIGVAINWGPF
ncbi:MULTISPECIES: YfcC family protein [unclassified Pantoea]|uniref:YfcC family protein n=1 Tax=unclassified Pantoea TaxID=2630326 RepID=UPI001CD21123|nr:MULTISPECIES: Na+/H+ antiporter NhaC family protein [unclassified Pantoea]MCA1177532.1 YfcC family protein [Pantoea sp. alder69]MCA1249562.1 YfcC family protein [Pantoea sp. alder70]MCA1266021.1 YfcC family protein [Pantoea sp. alder81]